MTVVANKPQCQFVIPTVGYLEMAIIFHFQLKNLNQNILKTKITVYVTT